MYDAISIDAQSNFYCANRNCVLVLFVLLFSPPFFLMNVKAIIVILHNGISHCRIRWLCSFLAMSSHRPSEPEFSTADSVTSTPRSDSYPPPPPRWHHDDDPQVRLMCSFGGRIFPRPHDNQLRYVDGETRIVAVHRSTCFSALLAKLAKLSGMCEVAVKYQLPNEDLDALISVTTDEDVENMMEEYDRLTTLGSVSENRTPRLRLFLFPPSSDSDGFGSTGSFKRDHWFLDVLYGGRGLGSIERGRSEVSSIVSEVPDYLFGLDNNSNDCDPKHNNRHMSVSHPSSPVKSVSSPAYYSTPSGLSVPPFQDLPPVKTKTENAAGTDINREMPVEEPVVPPYSTTPVLQYVQEPAPVYYIRGSIQRGNKPVLPVPVQMQFNYGHEMPMVAGGQLPVGYRQTVQGMMMSGPFQSGPVYIGARPLVAGPYNPPPPLANQGYNYKGGVVTDGFYHVPVNQNMVPLFRPAGNPLGGDLPVSGQETHLERKEW